MSTFVGFRDANITSEEGAGKILAKLVGQAVVVGAETSCRVEEKGGGADDTVDVQVGELIIIDDDGYALRAWSDAIENLSVTSNSSGDDRIDVVVAYIDKAVEDGVDNNSPDGLVFAIVDGTPAGSPTPPNDATIQAAVGADNPFIKLAQVEADDGFVSIVDADITDIREQASFQSGGKKLQYNPATDLWDLEDSLNIEVALYIADSERLGIDGSDQTTIGKNSVRATRFVAVSPRTEILDVIPNDTDWHDEDVSGETSARTFMIIGQCRLRDSAGAARNLYVRKNGDADAKGDSTSIMATGTHTGGHWAGFQVEVDASQIFEWSVDNLDVDEVKFVITGYWEYVD